MKQYSDKIIRHYLEKYHNDVKTVAAKLDIGKSTIYNLLKKWEEQENKISGLLCLSGCLPG